MSEPFVTQLAELCAAHPTRDKWIFVPSHAIGRTLGDRLVLEGTDWANLRFVTPLDIALRMGAPFLVERGIDPSEEGLGPALIMRLLLGLPEQPSYFRPLATQPTMAQALWTTIRELRLAGVKADHFSDKGFTSAEKHAELKALLAAYERFLADNKRGDMATVYEEALLHQDWCPVQAPDCWTELPDVLWQPLQRRLIDSMPGERIVPRTLSLPDAPIPRRLADQKVERVAHNGSVPLAGLLAHDAQPAGKNIHLFHAGGPEAEVEEVFRRIVASGRSLDQVEIACASDTYSTLIWEKACRYNWPVTLAAGLPATLTRPGRALVGISAWIESDFSAGLLRRMLQSGDVVVDGANDLTPGRAARLLVKAEAAWGRATYNLALTRLLRKYQTWAEEESLSDEQRAATLAKAKEVEELRTWVTRLIVAVPEAGADHLIDVQQLVVFAEAFVGSSVGIGNALDAAASVALRDALTELRGLGAFRCTLADGLRFLAERVNNTTVGVDRPRPGHLHVSRLSQCAYAGRPLFFVVGLEEGRVFPLAVEDPVLLDPEREHISGLLRCSGDKIEEAVHATVSRLAAASASPGAPYVGPSFRSGETPGAHITLSYSCRDLREYRHTFPSWLMLQARRVITGDPNQSYEQLKIALGEPCSCVPRGAADAISDAGWWLNGMKAAGESGKKPLLKQFPNLANGLNAEEQRDGEAFTAFDGYVPDAGKALDPCAIERPMSATALEDAAECPFRFFLKRGLGVDALEDPERQQDAWLDPMPRGLLLHNLYAQLMRRCRDAKRRPDLKKDGEWFATLGREALDRLRDEMPPPSDEVFERERDGVLGDLELFVRAECDGEASRTAIGFEVSFGKGTRSDDDLGSDPLDRAEPIEVELGKGLRLKLTGRIDRIDQIAPDTFEIIDYKTGGFFEKSYTGTFAGGTLLQHSLYGLAAADLLKTAFPRAKIAGGTYYFSAAKGRQERVEIKAPSKAATTAVLKDLRDVIASGLFVHADDAESACRFCDFGPACGTNPDGRAEAKAQDAKLEPYRRLVAHE